MAQLEIIVAEDNPLQRSMLVQLIEAYGYRTLEATDGAEALALVEGSAAQVLITDYQMPGLDGVELTRRVRALGLDHYVHIIMLTGRAEHGVYAQALAAGADDFISKGSDPAALKARLQVAERLITHASELASQHRILKAANDRITADLEAAANAQRLLLPQMRRQVAGTHIASAFEPSAVVSGDMFGCCVLDEDQMGFYAIDVSGHGIQAALLSVALGYLITPDYFFNAVLGAQDGTPDPAALVADLNTRFARSDSDDYFTMFCGVLNRTTGQLDYCQAAYPSPCYLTPQGETHVVGDGGFPVGMFAEAEFENAAVHVAPKGTLVICSDAAPEAESPDGTPFGTDRLQRLVSASFELGPDRIPQAVVEGLTDWRAGHPLEDDLTVIALQRI